MCTAYGLLFAINFFVHHNIYRALYITYSPFALTQTDTLTENINEKAHLPNLR